MEKNKNNIVLKFSNNNTDYYVYSTKGNDDESCKYYEILVENNKTRLNNIDNIAVYFKKLKDQASTKIEEIKIDSPQYINFMALKSYAENEKLNQLNKKR